MPWTTPGTAVAGDVLTASRWNSDVRDNTNSLYTSMQRLGYTTRTSNYSVAATTIASASDIFSSGITFTADGTSAYEVVFFTVSATNGTTAGATIVVSLTNAAGTDLGILGSTPPSNGTQAANCPIFARILYTPAAGSITLNSRARYAAATGTLLAASGGVGSVFPMYLAVYGPDIT